jgi:hypothetical protein
VLALHMSAFGSKADIAQRNTKCLLMTQSAYRATTSGRKSVARCLSCYRLACQQFSGVSSSILKKLLPVLAGILISGLMGSKPGKAAAPQAAPPPQGGGGLGDILGQIFGRGFGPSTPSPTPQQTPAPGGQTIPTGPEAQPGDVLGQILQELQKGIQEGRIKPVIIGGGPIQIPMPGGQGGPVQIPMPGGQGETIPSGQQVPGGDILGQILRDLLGGAGGPARTPQPSG